MSWKEREAFETVREGTCVEVRRDEDVTDAETLCGMHVMLPGPNQSGVPSCKACRKLLAAGALALAKASR